MLSWQAVLCHCMPLVKAGIACVISYPQHDVEVIKTVRTMQWSLANKELVFSQLTTTFIICFKVLCLADCVCRPFFHFSWPRQQRNSEKDGKILHSVKVLSFFSSSELILARCMQHLFTKFSDFYTFSPDLEGQICIACGYCKNAISKGNLSSLKSIVSLPRLVLSHLFALLTYFKGVYSVS